MINRYCFLLILLFSIQKLAYAQKDIILFDFENGLMKDWSLEGENPLCGGKPLSRNEMKDWNRGPEGFLGEFYLETGDDRGRHSDNPDGIWKSPAFKITRKYLNFYLGGEVNPNVKVYLEINGDIVRKAYGNNFYDLILRGWDVGQFKNQTARFCVEDQSPTPSLIRVDHIFLSNTPPPQAKEWVKTENRQRSSLVCQGEFMPVLAALKAGVDVETDYATIVFGHDNKWHLYASVMNRKDRWNAKNWKEIVHATADSISQEQWDFKGVVMQADPAFGEEFLWQPHVIFENGKYYMFYVGAGNDWSGWYPTPDGIPAPWYGGKTGDIGPFWMYEATSVDGKNWVRVGDLFKKGHKGCIFVDKPFAFQPYVTKIDSLWVLYYAGCSTDNILGKHAVVYRTSRDLLHWSDRQVALQDWSRDDPSEASRFAPEAVPSSPWPEHSFFRFPVIFKHNGTWYLWAGPIDNNNLSRYHCLRIYKSNNPYKFGNHWEALNINKRIFVDGGAKPIIDSKGNWYIYTTNLHSGGVWIAPLYWNDGLDNEPLSVPISK